MPPAEKGLYGKLQADSDNFEIRLLQISGGRELEMDSLVSCRMKVFRLSEAPAYRCLSYVWGKKEWHAIKVNGKQLYVTKNLLGFLQRIRAGSSNPDGYIWIDAICINQGDHEDQEGKSQRRRMGAIYARAEQVIAWLGWEWDRLGDGSDHGRNERVPHIEDAAEDAVALIRKLAKGVREWIADGGQPWSDQLSRHAFDASEMYELLRIDHVRTKTWRALAAFLNRAWFQRAWVVQEAALAQKLVPVCGFEVIPWDDIIQVAIFLQGSGWFIRLMQFVDPAAMMVPFGWRPLLFWTLKHTRDLQAPGPELGGIVPDPLAPLSSQKELGGPRYRIPPGGLRESGAFAILAQLVINTRSFGATEPQDKVYAPLALFVQMLTAHDSNLLTSAVIATIDKLYAASPDQVYTLLGDAVLEHSPDFTYLSHLEDRQSQGQLSLPSWVPDLMVTAHSPLCEVVGLTYNALPGRLKVCRIQHSSQSLSLDGHCLGRISAMPSSTLEQIYLSRDLRELIRFCLNDMTGQHRGDSLWRTLTGNSDGKNCPAKSESAACFKRYLEVCTAIWHYGDVPNPDLQSARSWADWTCFDELRAADIAAECAIPSTQELADFAETWREILVGGFGRLPEAKTLCELSDIFALATGRVYGRRRLFFSNSGSSGLAPASVKTGDQIWFLSGASVPFILRPADNDGPDPTFSLIGEAYVHGYMHGELMMREPAPSFHTIVIR